MNSVSGRSLLPNPLPNWPSCYLIARTRLHRAAGPLPRHSTRPSFLRSFKTCRIISTLTPGQSRRSSATLKGAVVRSTMAMTVSLFSPRRAAVSLRDTLPLPSRKRCTQRKSRLSAATAMRDGTVCPARLFPSAIRPRIAFGVDRAGTVLNRTRDRPSGVVSMMSTSCLLYSPASPTPPREIR